MIHIDSELCVGCGLCVMDCVTGYLSIKEPEHKAAATGQRCMACGHCEAICPRQAIEVRGGSYEAFENFELENAYADPEELAAFMANRRSVRNFRNEPIEQKKIDMIINAGRFSPTGCNNQTIGYIIMKDRLDDIRKRAALAVEGELLEEMSRSINRATLERIHDAAAAGGDRLFFGAPLVIALTDVKDNGVDAGIAASRMELMANALGLGVCFNGIFPILANNVPAIRELCGLPSNRKMPVSLVVGYPAVGYMRPAKRKRANTTVM